MFSSLLCVYMPPRRHGFLEKVRLRNSSQGGAGGGRGLCSHPRDTCGTSVGGEKCTLKHQERAVFGLHICVHRRKHACRECWITPISQSDYPNHTDRPIRLHRSHRSANQTTVYQTWGACGYDRLTAMSYDERGIFGATPKKKRPARGSSCTALRRGLVHRRCLPNIENIGSRCRRCPIIFECIRRVSESLFLFLKNRVLRKL